MQKFLDDFFAFEEISFVLWKYVIVFVILAGLGAAIFPICV